MSNILPPANLLDRESSPYLLQHKDNPVAWMPWGEPAFARARTEGKPILLSIGYAACHWCHVMARECFEDNALAAAINREFVAVKVDREERPDLDHIYQAALAMLGQPGGWPLTLFLNGDGEPFWGGTYFPPSPRYGRPGFGQVLTQIAETYRVRPGAVRRAAAALRQGLATLGTVQAAGPLPTAIQDRVAERLCLEIDPIFGGIGEAPKFPMVPAFELLWRAGLRHPDRPYRAAVTLTLDQMCQGGIYDHLAGGFARYATDAEWLVPHFEKMLYDNALLLNLLTLVWRGTGDRLYRQRIEETAGWVLRDMVADGGGFASSLDADSDHQEGKFAVWSVSDVVAVLGDDAVDFCRVYDVTEQGNWEGVNILHRRPALPLGSEAEEARLAALRHRLLQVRDRRPRPGWDDKVLADWNGLMIAALVEAALAFDRPDWLAAALRAFRFVTGRMVVDGRLRHSWRQGRIGAIGLLEDYAAMSQAALALFEATGEAPLIEQAAAWVTIVDAHFWDESRGGYFAIPDDGEALLVRAKSAQDTAIPSGNGLMIGVLARLYHLTGDDAYRLRAEAVIGAVSGEVNRNILGLATVLNQAELLDGATTVVIIGAPDDPATHALVRTAASASLPNRILAVYRPGMALPASHPAHGKTQFAGRATAMVCRDQRCGLPITEPEALAAALFHVKQATA